MPKPSPPMMNEGDESSSMRTIKLEKPENNSNQLQFRNYYNFENRDRMETHPN